MNDYETYMMAKGILETDYENAVKSAALYGFNDHLFFNRCDLFSESIFEKYKQYDTFTELISNLNSYDMELLSLINRLKKQYEAVKYNHALEYAEKDFYKFKKKVEQNN